MSNTWIEHKFVGDSTEVVKTKFNDSDGRVVNAYIRFDKSQPIAFISPEEQQTKEDYIVVAKYDRGFDAWYAETLLRLTTVVQKRTLNWPIAGNMSEALTDAAELVQKKRDETVLSTMKQFDPDNGGEL